MPRQLTPAQCLSVQCMFCQQTRAKNTSRQKQHLLECTANPANHGNGIRAQASPGNAIAAPNGFATPNAPSQTAIPGSASSMMNGVTPHATSLQTPLQNMASRPSLPPQSTVAGPSSLATPVRTTPASKTPKSTKQTPNTGLPPPPLDDVHASFVEFRAKDEDKVRDTWWLVVTC